MATSSQKNTDPETDPIVDAEASAKPTIHIVDDDPLILDMLRGACLTRGFNVQTYTSGEAFLEVVDDEPGCLVLDYRLPQKSGLQLLDELNERELLIPVIFISGNAEVSTAVDAFKAGTMDFLQKPFPLPTLLETIERAVERNLAERAERAKARAIAARVDNLTRRERQVMDLIVEGHSNREVAEEIGVSPKTVEVHRANAMLKMKAATFAELVKFVEYYRRTSGQGEP